MIYCLLLDLTQFSRVQMRKVFISLSIVLGVYCISCRLKVSRAEMASKQSLRVMLVPITEKLKQVLC